VLDKYLHVKRWATIGTYRWHKYCAVCCIHTQETVWTLHFVCVCVSVTLHVQLCPILIWSTLWVKKFVGLYWPLGIVRWFNAWRQMKGWHTLMWIFSKIQFPTIKMLCLHYRDQSVLFRDVIAIYCKDQTGPGGPPVKWVWDHFGGKAARAWPWPPTSIYRWG